MKHYISLSKQLKLFSLLICALTLSLPLVAAQALPSDNSANTKTLYDQLMWDAHTVQIYKKTIPITLRNRKIKHYALTAAVVGGVVGYVWYVNQSTKPELASDTATQTTKPDNTVADTGKTAKKWWPNNDGDMNFTEENFKQSCELLKKLHPEKSSDWFVWANLGGLQLPYCPRLEPIAQATKAVATWSIGSFAFNKATSIFSFKEDMPWFYNEEKSIAITGKNLEAQALDFDAAVATKQPKSVILLKKHILLESAHHYVDCLMALYVFMEHRSAQLVAKFDPEIRKTLQKKFSMQATSIMQNGIEFCQKLNNVVAKTAHDTTQSTETARVVAMQTHNLVQALVASFVRLEDLYNK